MKQNLRARYLVNAWSQFSRVTVDTKRIKNSENRKDFLKSERKRKEKREGEKLKITEIVFKDGILTKNFVIE